MTFLRATKFITKLFKFFHQYFFVRISTEARFLFALLQKKKKMNDKQTFLLYFQK